MKTNWLASPPLVATAWPNIRTDLTTEPIGEGFDGQTVYLKDIWPTQTEIDSALQNVNTEMFHKEHAEVLEGDAKWKKRSRFYKVKPMLGMNNPPYIRIHPFLQKLISQCD